MSRRRRRSFGGAAGGGGAAFEANPVNFDGTNDWLTRGGGLTDAADSKLWSGSFWFKRNTTNAVQRIFGNDLPSGPLIGFSTSGASPLHFSGSPLDVVTSEIGDTTSWHHCMFSFDMADTAKRHIYVDEVSDIAQVNKYMDNALDFTTAMDWRVGATLPAAGDRLDADLADVQIWFGKYIDLSIEANRRLFITADGKPVDPAVAAASDLGDPIVLLSGDTDTWHTNDGTGGGFTETGALTDGTGPVEL